MKLLLLLLRFCTWSPSVIGKHEQYNNSELEMCGRAQRVARAA